MLAARLSTSLQLIVGSRLNWEGTMKQIACADVVPGCDFTAEAATEDELLQKVATHAREVHGIDEVTPDLVKTVKSKIREK
jgi:predicted small metal-binding protein